MYGHVVYSISIQTQGEGSCLTFLFIPLVHALPPPSFYHHYPPHLEPNLVTTHGQLDGISTPTIINICEFRAENQGSHPWRKTVTHHKYDTVYGHKYYHY